MPQYFSFHVTQKGVAATTHQNDVRKASFWSKNIFSDCSRYHVRLMYQIDLVVSLHYAYAISGAGLS